MWRYIEQGAPLIHSSTIDEPQQMRALMARYKDVPMNLAGASLIAAAKAEGLMLIFTSDANFHIHGIKDREPFEVGPQARKATTLSLSFHDLLQASDHSPKLAQYLAR